LKTIDTNELRGAYLNYAVAISLGHKVHINEVLRWHQMPGPWISGHIFDPNTWIQLYQYRPSDNWARGGPIIDQYIDQVTRISDKSWIAIKCQVDRPDVVLHSGQGETALIAAMRCLVRSKLGDTVEIPDNLFCTTE